MATIAVSARIPESLYDVYARIAIVTERPLAAVLAEALELQGRRLLRLQSQRAG